MTRYYFARHGESEANEAGILAGSIDYPLTNNGVKQAVDTANNIKESGVRFDSILSSPLLRAYHTAKVIAEVNQYKEEDIHIIDELSGGAGGDLEGLPYKHWYDTPEEEIVDHGGEDAETLRRRVGKAIIKIIELTCEDENILIVSHAGIYQMLKAIYNEVEPATEAYKIINTKNGEFTEINIKL